MILFIYSTFLLAIKGGTLLKEAAEKSTNNEVAGRELQ
jgi:hypothetical protein